MFNLIAFRGQLDDALATSGATRGHSAAADAFSVAATPAAAPSNRRRPRRPVPRACSRPRTQSESFTLGRPATDHPEPERQRDHAGQPHQHGRRRSPEAGHHGRRRRRHRRARLQSLLRHLGRGAARGRDRGAPQVGGAGSDAGAGPHGIDQHRHRHRGDRASTATRAPASSWRRTRWRPPAPGRLRRFLDGGVAVPDRGRRRRGRLHRDPTRSGT